MIIHTFSYFYTLSFFQALEVNRKLCAEIAPLSMDLVDAFGLPEEVLAAPIASDWVKYNEIDNQGELSAKSDFMKVIEEFSKKQQM